MNAPVPLNEEARLAALRQYHVLDSLPEQTYDDITHLAAMICDTPVAMISLVDRDRQWFKSRIGVDMTETPRAHAFCAHAILRPDEVMVVGDARHDARFSGNPLVTGEPQVRFYAGAPLLAPTGEALGTMCVIDRTPREITPDQMQALQALARQVVSQLELRRALAELEHRSAEQQRYQEQLEELSATDGLTGLKNRQAFDQLLQAELALASRRHSAVSLFMIDVDEFKSYNDEFGHPGGDAALRQVARLLQAQARKGEHVARYGGEEFSLILPDTLAPKALLVAERLRHAIEAHAWALRQITVSIGVATALPPVDGATLVERADQALYRAKQAGRNRAIAA
ncbi:MAG TPA: sensor domain-containing diguanylate cyclase [Burkholderiaceae bacterium]|nr:sensor domain-containing diguanylate cyclase [Burkholderiaceae bacterium]